MQGHLGIIYVVADFNIGMCWIGLIIQTWMHYVHRGLEIPIWKESTGLII